VGTITYHQCRTSYHADPELHTSQAPTLLSPSFAPSPPVPLPSLSLPFPSLLLEVVTLNTARGLGSAVSFPSEIRNLAHFGLKI